MRRSGEINLGRLTYLLLIANGLLLGLCTGFVMHRWGSAVRPVVTKDEDHYLIAADNVR